MSAIWGCISYQALPSMQSVKALMETPYHRFKIDHYSVATTPYSIMGMCSQNLFSDTADTAPIGQDSLLFASDAFIDNTDELANSSELTLQCPDIDRLSDHELLYHAYRTWGNSFHQHVCGAFAFAVTDTISKSSYIYADHLANRSIFYRLVNDTLYFSTIMDSLVSIAPTTTSEAWMTGFLSTYSADMNVAEHATPYKDIFQLGAGEYLSFTPSGVTLHKYWDPRVTDYEQIYTTEDEYQRLLVDTVKTSIRSLLRPSATVGCTLSSGLDSSTVACIAADMLKDKQCSLRSYTSIPLKEYKNDLGSFYITNEKPGVEEICKLHTNILPTYIDCDGKNSIEELRRITFSLGIPSKSMQNLVWLDEIYKTAATDNCKLLLKGQYGNATISYGNVMSVVYQQLADLHPLKAYSTLADFCHKNRVSKKLAAKTFSAYYLDRLRPPKMENQGVARPELQKGYKTLALIKGNIRHSGGANMDSWQERKNFLFFPQGLAQLGMYDTVFGLQYGLLIRDPLKDKRLIELCCRLPIECYVAGHIERAMVRTYMKDIIPDTIRLNVHQRGLQSADALLRVQMNWDRVKPLLLSTVQSPALKELVNTKVYDEIINAVRETTSETLTEELLQKVYTLYTAAVYLEYAQERIGDKP
ncbi:MAG: hypothetical protein IJZ82_05130 [Lachnospiraceae bacterium]|nr:hypothetical protein [Lachnospiraceae bacterium]